MNETKPALYNGSHYQQQQQQQQQQLQQQQMQNQQHTDDVAAESKDEVDFVVISYNNNNYDNKIDNKIPTTTTTTTTTTKTVKNKSSENMPKKSKELKQQHQLQQQQSQLQCKDATINSKRKFDENLEHKKSKTMEKLSLFTTFGKKFNQHKNVTTTQNINNVNNCNNNKNMCNKESKDAQETTIANETKTTTKIQTPTQTLTPLVVIPIVPIGTPPRQHKFAKSSSIARLLGNTYNAKKFEKQEQKRLANDGKFNTFGGRRRANGPYLERFRQRCTKEEGDQILSPTDNIINSGGMALTTDLRELYGGSRHELIGLQETDISRRALDEDISFKAFRTISRGLGKLWWRRSHSVDISAPDPEFKVSYLGNVLTGWAKGENCVEKQLNTLWKNYTQNNKPDVIMRLKVCASGLKATTRQHGLTEYWANRITHCCTLKTYPRVFCWIYRHEGRKLKHELRCHAVLCSKEKIVHDICNTLKENLESALREFKRDKILKQNARLSLANAADDNPSLPRRKIMLSVGGNNYRPPLERSKSAPKLMAIEEAIGEEGEEAEDTNEPEMKSCCQKDSLYPAMTLGRRRCRRGHSIRRTGKTRPDFSQYLTQQQQKQQQIDILKYTNSSCCNAIKCNKTNNDTKEALNSSNLEQFESHNNIYGSDDSDEFEKLLKYNNYDMNGSLANELLPYFDMQLHKKTSCSLGSLIELKEDEEPISLSPTINSNPNAALDADYDDNMHNDDLDDNVDHVVVGLRLNGVCSDGEEDYLEPDDLYFRQTAIFNILHRNSMRKMANLSLSSDESSSIETNASAPLQYRHQQESSISSNASSTANSATVTLEGHLQNSKNLNGQRLMNQQINMDSDEGSISSGCETASTITANQDDICLNYRQKQPAQLEQEQAATPAQMVNVQQLSEYGLLDEEPITIDEIYQRLETRLQKRQNSDATTFSSSSSITLKMGTSPTTSIGGGLDVDCNVDENTMKINSVTATTTTTTTINTNGRNRRAARRHVATVQREREQCMSAHDDDTDSECSDESGYVEFQEKDKIKNGLQIQQQQQQQHQQQQKQQHQHQQLHEPQKKPQVPPKPMPRRFLSVNTATAV